MKPEREVPNRGNLRAADASTLDRVRAIGPGIRTHGIGWLGRRLLNLLSEPGRLPGRLWRFVWVLLYVGLLGSAAAVICLVNPRKRVTVFYDLKVAPVTFDVCWALAAAEYLRLQRGFASVRLVLVPGPVDGFREEDAEFERIVDHDTRRRRLDAIHKQVAALVPSLDDVVVCRSRCAATWRRIVDGCAVLPVSYWPALPRAMRPRYLLERKRAGDKIPLPFRAPPSAVEAVAAWIDALGPERSLVVITLRQFSYTPVRNSNLDAWVAFAAELDPDLYRVVFVPDTEVADGPADPRLADFPMMTAAAHDIAVRMALYERAYLNLMVNNGPHLLCLFNAHCRCLLFKVLTPGVPQTTPEYMRYLGFEVGQTPPLAPAHHRWIWEDDELPVIQREFARMVGDIEAVNTVGSGPAN